MSGVVEVHAEVQDPPVMPEKRKRGRPRKEVIAYEAEAGAEGVDRKRGRPSKDSDEPSEKGLRGLTTMLRWYFDAPEVEGEPDPSDLKEIEGGGADETQLEKALVEVTVVPETVIPEKKRKPKIQSCNRCEVEGCNISRTYGFPGGKRARCKKHAEPGMVPKKSIICQEEGCTTTASLGYPSKDGPGYTSRLLSSSHVPTHCSKHSKPGQVNLVNKRCQAEGCYVLPSLGWPNGRASHCKQHALPGMERVFKQECKTEGCKKRPGYGFTADGLVTMCAAHAEPGMVLLKGPRCTLCGGTAYYGVRGRKSLLTRCRVHREPDMVNLTALHCDFEGCLKEATFGLTGSKAVRCKLHKDPEMTDVRNKVCEEEGCDVTASYGLKGGGPKHCGAHKRWNEVYVKRRHCTFEGCEVLPGFRWPGKPPDRCNKHKEPGMISVNTRECEVEGCEAKGKYRIPNSGKWFCIEHKTPEMSSKNTECGLWGCTSRASYGYPDEGVRMRCAKHVLSGMVNLSLGKKGAAEDDLEGDDLGDGEALE